MNDVTDDMTNGNNASNMRHSFNNVTKKLIQTSSCLFSREFEVQWKYQNIEWNGLMGYKNPINFPISLSGRKTIVIN